MVRARMNRLSAFSPTSDVATDIGALEIPLYLIDPDPDQPRLSFDELKLDELADSIKAQGIIEPLVVSPHPDRAGRYMLVAGERRWRAARMAGLSRVPVVLRNLPEEQRLAVQLVENIDREALTVLEEAAAVVRLIDAGHRPKAIADMLGKSPAWVSLRRKIAAHRGGLDYVVAQGLTRDAETLAMLAELEQLEPDAFGELLSSERIRRADVRARLDIARRRHLAMTALRRDEGHAAPRAKGGAASAIDGIHLETRRGDHGGDFTVDEAATRNAEIAPHDRAPEADAGAVKTTGPAPVEAPSDRGKLGAYRALQRTFEAVLGLPVSIEPPSAAAPGVVRIAFDEEWMLADLQRRLTLAESGRSVPGDPCPVVATGSPGSAVTAD